jgi:hypothetical protein
MALTSLVECNYVVLNTEQGRDQLPVNERAAEAV